MSAVVEELKTLVNKRHDEWERHTQDANVAIDVALNQDAPEIERTLNAHLAIAHATLAQTTQLQISQLIDGAAHLSR